MAKSGSTPCAHPRCARVTTDPSGRCHDHRKPSRAVRTFLPPPPAPLGERYRTEVPGGEWMESYRSSSSGEPDRIGGPASEYFRKDGTLSARWWLRNDVEHRVDGPALIAFDSDGVTEIGETWYYRGGKVSGPREIAERLRARLPSVHIEEFGNSSYRVLLEEGIDSEEILGALEGGVYSLDGIREVTRGAPAEWVATYEASRS